jgi:hypothetical protein
MSDLKRSARNMALIRWLFSVPAALLASGLTWALLSSIFSRHYYGGGLARSAIGLAPLFTTTALSSLACVVAGVWIAPSRRRWITFLFFPFAVLFSLGGIEMLKFQELDHGFWLTAAFGQMFGGLIGLIMSLKMQNRRISNHKVRA